MKSTEFIKRGAGVKFAFSSSQQDHDQDGKTIVTLFLTTPYERVKGSLPISRGARGNRVLNEMFDVMEVKVHERAMTDDDGIQFNEDGSGTIDTTKLMLDISSRDEVWLTDQKFAQFGRDRRNKQDKEREDRLNKQVEDRKAELLLKKEVIGKAPVVPVTVVSGDAEKNGEGEANTVKKNQPAGAKA